MADFNVASQIQPFQAPNVLGVAEHVQKMQTSNMLMQQRAAELQKENALRAAAAQYGVNSKAYAEAAGRIDPEAGLKAFTYQRQQAAAGAAAAQAAQAAAYDRIRADSATVDLVNKHGARFEQALRMVDTTENPAATYDKLYSILPPSLKPFYPDKYSPENVQRALSTNAEVVASLAPAKPTIYPGTADMAPQAYVPGKGGALGTMSLIPETPIPNQLTPPAAAAAVPGVNQLAPPAAAPGANQSLPAVPTTPSEMRAQAAARAQAAELDTFKKKEAIKRDMSAELSPVEEQKLRTQVGEARTNAGESLATAQGVLDAAKALRAVPDNDKNRILGLSGEYTYNFTDAAKNAQTKFNDIKGQVTGMAKAAAGSIGSMAVQEWKILADQIATLEAKNLTPKALNEQLDIIVHRAEGLMRRTKQNYTSTYSPLISRYEGQFDLAEPEPRPEPKPAETPAAPARGRAVNGRSALPAGVTSSGW
jgi:exoribonuclease R